MNLSTASNNGRTRDADGSKGDLKKVALFPLNIYEPLVTAACTERQKAGNIFPILIYRLNLRTHKLSLRLKKTSTQTKYFKKVLLPSSKFPSLQFYGETDPFYINI